MECLKGVIVKGLGADHVMIETCLPDPCYPFIGNLTVTFRVAQGDAERYVSEHFKDVPFKVVKNIIRKG